jgi:hypothetical protein
MSKHGGFDSALCVPVLSRILLMSQNREADSRDENLKSPGANVADSAVASQSGKLNTTSPYDRDQLTWNQGLGKAQA